MPFLAIPSIRPSTRRAALTPQYTHAGVPQAPSKVWCCLVVRFEELKRCAEYRVFYFHLVADVMATLISTDLRIIRVIRVVRVIRVAG